MRAREQAQPLLLPQRQFLVEQIKQLLHFIVDLGQGRGGMFADVPTPAATARVRGQTYLWLLFLQELFALLRARAVRAILGGEAAD